MRAALASRVTDGNGRTSWWPPSIAKTEEGEFNTWLDGTPEEAFGLVKSYDPEAMCMVQSGFEKKELLAA